MPLSPEDQVLSGKTQEVYARNAARFDRERPKDLRERRWLDRFLVDMPPGATVVDLGCGAGDPIAAYLHAQGLKVIGIDASRPMIEMARSRLPEVDWRIADMRTLALDVRVHGLLAWNSFFHLTADEQRALLPRLARYLLPEGRLLLTVGPEHGEAIGRVGDDPIYHASLSLAEYSEILETHGARVIEFLAEDRLCDFQTVLIAKRLGD